MQERIFLTIGPAWCAADDNHGGFFGIGAGDGVQSVQSTDAISDADEADAVDAGIGVGGEAGAGFVGHGDALNWGFFEPGEGR